MQENSVPGGKCPGESEIKPGGFYVWRKLSWEDYKKMQEENVQGVFCHGNKK